MTRFSFIVSCYNLEKYIVECLDSLTNQKYPQDAFEIVVIDDGSTDTSYDIISKYASRFSNIRVLKTENSGLEKTCNRGIQLAAYDWVIRVDGDDMLHEEFLATMDRAIQIQPDYDFYYCRDYIEYYSQERQLYKTLPPFDVEEVFSRGDFFATATIYKKSQLTAIGFFPENIKNCGLENYNVVLRLISTGKKGLAVSGAKFYYRRHLTNMSIVKERAIIEYGHQLLASYGRRFVTNENHPYGLKIR